MLVLACACSQTFLCVFCRYPEVEAFLFDCLRYGTGFPYTDGAWYFDYFYKNLSFTDFVGYSVRMVKQYGIQILGEDAWSKCFWKQSLDEDPRSTVWAFALHMTVTNSCITPFRVTP